MKPWHSGCTYWGGRDRRSRAPSRRASWLLLLIVAFAVPGLGTASASFAAAAPPTTVTLAPASATISVGGSHTVTATVTPIPQGGGLTFKVTSGPNAGQTGSALTDATGSASFTYTGSTPGTDTLTATYTSVTGAPYTSNAVTATWAVVPKTDTKVTMSAPSFVRVGKPAAFTAVVSNGGPDTATGVVLQAPVPAGATFSSASSSVGSCTGGATVTCVIGTLASGASATVTITLSMSNAGSLTLTSTVQGDYDTNTGNNTASATTTVIEQNAVPPPPPPSAQPGTFNAVGTGSILVNGVQRPADQMFVLNSGDVVDVTTGIVTFTDSDGKYGSWSSTQLTVRREANGIVAPALSVTTAADSVPSKFQVQQPATPGGPTTLTLVGGDFSVCNSPRSLVAKNKKPVRQLWGSAKGSFTTKGRFASATVRGTVWFVQDRCDGTLTQVVEGVVGVFDPAQKKTVSVGPGQSYLALAPVRLEPPTSTPKQTPAQVSRHGLVWGTKNYKNRQTFEKYLKTKGQTWQQFATAYPRLAAALSKRK